VQGWLGLDDAWRIIDEAMAAGARAPVTEPGTWR
jgi:hypothetical protein